ncbi:hypothetical protein [Kribbella sp. VKM Ac-2568]|uniref:hypothetical protein n=1 Tax=Kribbella sp. VKM Ac-2568 TaxID=2512219 RepID=UPI0010EEA370|nr:hypothetical protein [Kribbella sp. VKM Ac-2568]TCM50315.1 hypothetical protein EV648_102359 [Kribbella sp. VKM Ac-2568]
MNTAAERSGATATEPREPSVAPRPRASGLANIARLVPWLVPVGAGVGGLLAIDVPLAPIVKYCVYFACCVVLPGILVLRFAWRSTGNWAEDVGLGAAVGMVWQLLGWAIFTALGLQSWLPAWPILVLAAFVVVPRLRPCWRIAAPAPLPVAWSWGLAICATALVVITTFTMLADHKAPPNGTYYYQDLLFHLSMVNELMRSMPPQWPQAVGVPLEYHWFANADMAGAVDITRVSPALVLFRLWLLPQAVVVLLVSACLARQVSKVWWTGVLAALAVLPTTPASLLSPSTTFSIVTGAAAAIFLIDVLFRRSGARGAWVLAAALAVVGGGSKPTVLPILLGGVGLAALFVLIRDRKLPWRSIGAGVILLLALIGTLRFVSGSTGGSGLQFFGVARFRPDYQVITGDTSPPGTGGLLPPSLTSGDQTAIAGVAVMLGLHLLSSAGLLAGFGLLLVRKTRRDPVAWLLVGALTGAWAGMLLVNHPSAGQLYFLRSVVPFAAAAAAWLVAVAFEGRSRRTIAVVSVSALVLGYVFYEATKPARRQSADPRAAQVEALAQPLLVAAVLTALLVVGWLLINRLWVRQPGLGVAIPVLVVTALSLVALTNRSYFGIRADGTYRAVNAMVHPDEQAAALWLGANSRPTDVVVTGSWCQSAGPRKAGCDARGYLVSGLAGRRTVMEGWAYTQQALATDGAGGKRYMFQPSPWPDRVQLTLQILTAPTAELLEEARTQYGARWIFADQRDGPVSAKLDELAVLRYQQGEIKIYELGP